MDETTPFTISLWMYNGLQTFKKGKGLWGIGIPDTGRELSGYQNVGDGHIGIDFWGTTTYATATPVLGNGWDHVVWTYDASNQSVNWLSSVTVYVNGNVVALQTSSIGSIPINIDVGKLYVGGIGTSMYNSSTYIDQMRIFNKSLTPDEVLFVYEERE